MNSIPGVEIIEEGNPSEEINSIKDNSNQDLVASLNIITNEKPSISILNNNHTQVITSPKTRSSTKEPSNKPIANNFLNANDFIGIPKKTLSRNSKHNNSITNSNNQSIRKVTFKEPFEYIVEIESFKREYHESIFEFYKKKKFSSVSTSTKSCCKDLTCIII